MISCPKCKGMVFQTGLHMCKRANVAFENERLTVYPVDNEIDNSLIQCVNCNEKYLLNDPKVVHMLTHPLIKCVECGKEFTEEELDENNVCAICRLKKIDKGFANLEGADPFTLMRALAQVRIENLELSRKNESVQQELQRAEEIHQAEEAEDEDQPKPKRKRRTKAEMEAARAAEEQTEEDTVEIDGDDTEESDIVISEDVAPEISDEVADMSKAMNPPVED